MAAGVLTTPMLAAPALAQDSVESRLEKLEKQNEKLARQNEELRQQLQQIQQLQPLAKRETPTMLGEPTAPAVRPPMGADEMKDLVTKVLTERETKKKVEEEAKKKQQ